MTSLENKKERDLRKKFQIADNKKLKGDKKNKFMKVKKIDKAVETAVYYGFTPIEQPTIEKIDLDNAKTLIEKEPIFKNNIVSYPLEISLEEKNSLLRYYADNNLIAEPQPIMLSYNNTTVLNRQKNPSIKERFLNLHILGSSKSISEAILIKTALAILSDNKIGDVCVDINSIGDRESTNKFVKELTNYYRKNINGMTLNCRQLFKKDVFSLLECDREECCRALNENAPKAISFLSEPSRQHFKEVLEGLEALDIPYRINNSLVPDRRYCSQTIFEIIRVAESKKDVIASGSRYDGLAKKIGLKKDIPAIGLRIYSKKLLDNVVASSKIKIPVFFFIQLGFEAKLKSLNIIEMLRKVKIIVCQSLSRDMLGGQIALAEKMRIPYALIMGKKESMDNTVMVRDMNTRSQKIIGTENLSAYLKKFK